MLSASDTVPRGALGTDSPALYWYLVKKAPMSKSSAAIVKRAPALMPVERMAPQRAERDLAGTFPVLMPRTNA